MFDSQALLQRLGGDQQLVDRLVGVFLVEAPKLLAQACAAIARLDWNAAGFAAHNLRGLAANIGFAQMGAVAEELERRLSAMSHTASSASADEIVRRLADAIEQSSQELNDYLQNNA
jgi:HPt (histidine-containing phosphotransfer) domain-containing protein